MPLVSDLAVAGERPLTGRRPILLQRARNVIRQAERLDEIGLPSDPIWSRSALRPPSRADGDARAAMWCRRPKRRLQRTLNPEQFGRENAPDFPQSRSSTFTMVGSSGNDFSVKLRSFIRLNMA